MNIKKILFTTALSFIFINIVTFCMFYIPNFVIMELSNLIYESLRILTTFLTKFFDFLMPVAAAAVLFAFRNRIGIKKTLLCGLILSLPRIFYILPYYYLQFWIYGSDSIEAVTLAAFASLFGIAVFFGETILLLYIIRTFARLPILKELKSKLPLNHQKNTPKNIMSELKKNADDALKELSPNRAAFNLNSPITIGVLAASFAEFFISFVFELSDFIGYLIEYVGDYRTGEIIEFTAYLVFLAVELLATHAICCFILNFIKKSEDKK